MPTDYTNLNASQQDFAKANDRAMQTLLELHGDSLPNISNRNTNSLIDEVAELGAMKRAFEKAENMLKEQLKLKMGEEGKNEGRGERYDVSITAQARTILNQEAAKEFILANHGGDVLAGLMSTTSSPTMRFKKRGL